jgi:hypothetical protein
MPSRADPCRGRAAGALPGSAPNFVSCSASRDLQIEGFGCNSRQFIRRSPLQSRPIGWHAATITHLEPRVTGSGPAALRTAEIRPHHGRRGTNARGGCPALRAGPAREGDDSTDPVEGPTLPIPPGSRRTFPRGLPFGMTVGTEGRRGRLRARSRESGQVLGRRLPNPLAQVAQIAQMVGRRIIANSANCAT